MYACDVCGKGILRGNNVSHAKNRTKRIYMPNLHTVKTLINGTVTNIKVCTKCLRKVVKAPKRDLSKVIAKVVKAVEPEKVKEVVEEKKVTKVKKIKKTVKKSL